MSKCTVEFRSVRLMDIDHCFCNNSVNCFPRQLITFKAPLVNDSVIHRGLSMYLKTKQNKTMFPKSSPARSVMSMDKNLILLSCCSVMDVCVDSATVSPKCAFIVLLGGLLEDHFA